MNANPRFFLGANSPQGFYSLQSELMNIEKSNRIIYIKGGPGTGKSTLMNQIARRLGQKGIACEYIYCSSDAASLDGVHFPGLKSAVLDATAPHVGEPKYFGAVEEYLSLCPYIDLEAVRRQKDRIISLTQSIKGEFAGAYKCISAARVLADYRFDLMLSDTNLERLSSRGRSFAEKYLSPGPGGRMQKRFLTAIAPQGLVGFFDDVAKAYENVVTLDDPFGMGPFLLAPILEKAEVLKQPGYACYCPSNPKKLEHLLFPSLSLAFITTNPYLSWMHGKLRNISVVTALSKDARRRHMRKYRSVLRTERGLYAEAVACLAREKQLHDELEGCYIPYLHKEKLEALAAEVADKLLKE